MKKNILIGGSFVAVILIVLASFTSVVGYSSLDKNSNYINSPLFTIRTQKAIDNNRAQITSQYIGKDRELFISIPLRDVDSFFSFRVINRISKFNDDQINRLKQIIINKLHSDERFEDIDNNQIYESLQYIRNHPNEVKQYIVKSDSDSSITINNWIPGCFCLKFLIELIIISIYAVLYILITLDIIQSITPWGC